MLYRVSQNLILTISCIFLHTVSKALKLLRSVTEGKDWHVKDLTHFFKRIENL